MGAATQTFIGGVIVALVAGVPAAGIAIWRGHRMTPKEEDDLVARTSGAAVQMMDTALQTAARERETLVSRAEELRHELVACRKLTRAKDHEIAGLRERLERAGREEDPDPA